MEGIADQLIRESLEMKNPKLIMIIGCVGLTLNLLSVFILHEEVHSVNHNEMKAGITAQLEHGYDQNLVAGKTAQTQSNTSHHQHHKDLGMIGVITHLIGDAINNIGVIIAGLIIWKVHHPARFYADPAASVIIAIMILITAFPLCKSVGSILMESVPLGIRLEDIRQDLEKIPGVVAIHDLHAWRLSQQKSLASAHVLTTDDSLKSFMCTAKLINQCLNAYGIHTSTLQPGLVVSPQFENIQAKENGTHVKSEELMISIDPEENQRKSVRE